MALKARRSTAPPSVLPDISPTRGEIGSFGLGTFLATSAIDETSAEVRSPPLVGEMSGRTEGGDIERRAFAMAW
jgi:hypothetical protein